MPLNKSLELLKQDYCDYIMYIKAKETAEMQLKSDDNIEIDTDYGIKKSILEYLHNELESDPMKQFSVKNIELLIVYLNRIKSKALQFANFENETNSEGNAYGEQDSDDCNLDNGKYSTAFIYFFSLNLINTCSFKIQTIKIQRLRT